MDIARNVAPYGLTQQVARARLQEDGPNEIARRPPRSIFAIALQVIKEPMFQLLFAAGVIYLLLGDLGEALMLLGFVVLSASISVIQEKRTENVLEALRDLSSPRALVIREGQQQRIAGREVVREDILVLTEGDRVPADARLMSTVGLMVDESLLTGESVFVEKWAQQAHEVFAGTLVVKGHGLACVTQTGAQTEIGKIGSLLKDIEDEPTQLHIQTRRFVKIFGVFGITLSLVMVLAIGLTRGEWLDGILAGITLAMAVLPEEFALVLTVFMAMGAWRMSRHQVLTRKSAVIEALGAATVLCTDKTGTLTLNQMSVAAIRANGQEWRATETEMPHEFHPVLEYAILASAQQPTDPMEIAFHALGEQHLKGTEHLHGEWLLAYEYALSAELLAMSHVWQPSAGEGFEVAAKGAPEAVIDLCHLPTQQALQIRDQANAMAAQGMRVLGVARARVGSGSWPGHQHDLDFEFLGLIGLADPLRESAAQAIATCRQAGIRVVMITGDYPVTALAIARQAGIASASDSLDSVMTGQEIAALSDAELADRVSSVRVFARIKPEQKLAIVHALKSRGEVVAMTGDGVNDAPALKAAHIGIAMGQRGTDVAREAASIVLLKDDFGSIVRAIERGRSIYANLKKALAYIIAVHVPIAGLALLPLALGMPMLLFPAHIAFLEMVIDPTSCFVFESEEAESDAMKRSPRRVNEPLFSRALLAWSVFQGVVVFLAIGGLVGWLSRSGSAIDEIRAASFAALVISGSALVWLNRGRASGHRRLNRSMTIIFSLTGLALALVMLAPSLRELFRFAALGAEALVAVGLATSLSFVVIWLARGWFSRRQMVSARPIGG